MSEMITILMGSRVEDADSCVDVGASAGGSRTRRLSLYCRLAVLGSVEDDVGLLERNQTAVDHLIQPGQDLFNPLRVLDDLNDDGQVL
jgi:hypothetical protein